MIRRNGSAAVLIALAGALLAPIIALGQTAAELEQQISDHNREIVQLNEEIAKYEAELASASSKKQTLQNTIDQLNISRKKITASINATKKRIATTELEIKQLSQGIAVKEHSIKNDKAGLAEMLRRLNAIETEPLLVRLLSKDGVDAIWADIDAMAQLQVAVRDDIAKLAQQRKSLTQTKTTAEGKRADLVKQQKTLAAEQGSLDATRKTQSELLAQTKSQESNFQAILRQKQAEKVAFEAALFELASKLDYTLDPTRIPPAGKGILRWPLDNVYITQQFGKTSSAKRLYTSGTHDGIDFRASLATPVRASLSGTVMEVNHGAVQNCQYGKWVLIRHGNGLATLYAHLSDISVSKGASVTTGQVIGYSGSTGYATGPHLHFTVYLSEAVSFKQYICKSGRSVTVPIAPLNAYLNPLDYL